MAFMGEWGRPPRQPTTRTTTMVAQTPIRVATTDLDICFRIAMMKMMVTSRMKALSNPRIVHLSLKTPIFPILIRLVNIDIVLESLQHDFVTVLKGFPFLYTCIDLLS